MLSQVPRRESAYQPHPTPTRQSHEVDNAVYLILKNLTSMDPRSHIALSGTSLQIDSMAPSRLN